MHERARREWYAPSEHLPNEELIEERYRGIRPAFGYPACPDHSEKRASSRCSTPSSAGIVLTESCATLPAASVSGLLLGHPQARYFSIGRIGRDQVEDYAARKGVAPAEAERWLRPNLAYEPQEYAAFDGVFRAVRDAESGSCSCSETRRSGHAPLGELRMSG